MADDRHSVAPLARAMPRQACNACMRIWIVNPYDPLPGDIEQLGRYGQLCRRMIADGHEVTWWTSDFVHRFKRPIRIDSVRSAANEEGFAVEFIETPPYSKNVSLRRLWSHRVFAGRLRRRADASSCPDVIVASSPPLEAAFQMADYGHAGKIPVIIDVQDQWPDTFVRALPHFIQPLRSVVLWPWYRSERMGYRRAHAICGVARGYVERALQVGGPKTHVGEFPLGADGVALREAAARGASRFRDRWQKPKGQLRFVYAGSLSRSYDCLTIVHAARQVRERCGDAVRFVITGRGELAKPIDAFIGKHRLDNVIRAGFVEPDEWAYLMSNADAGFNASTPDSLIYLPNKIFAYNAFGLAVLNTITGQCAEIVEQTGCGLNYQAGSVRDCARAIAELADDRPRLEKYQAESRALGERRFNVHVIAEQYAQFIYKVGKCGCG